MAGDSWSSLLRYELRFLSYQARVAGEPERVTRLRPELYIDLDTKRARRLSSLDSNRPPIPVYFHSANTVADQCAWEGEGGGGREMLPRDKGNPLHPPSDVRKDPRRDHRDLTHTCARDRTCVGCCRVIIIPARGFTDDFAMVGCKKRSRRERR